MTALSNPATADVAHQVEWLPAAQAGPLGYVRSGNPQKCRVVSAKPASRAFVGEPRVTGQALELLTLTLRSVRRLRVSVK